MIKDFNKLSERQRNMLRFIQKYVEKFGYPPTIRDIGDATDIPSTSVVNYNLNKLVEAGYLERSEHVSRGLRMIANIPDMPVIVGKNPRRIGRGEDGFIRIPQIGHIVASAPVQVPETVGHYIDSDHLIELPPSMLKGVAPEETFALQVKGNSMMDAMVREGDIVILHHQSTARSGEMVAVWLPENGETTLKYYYPEGEMVRLQPAHPTMDAIYVKASNCEIKGRVISVLRIM